jgi:DNA-binding transcriptional MerR regulator
MQVNKELTKLYYSIGEVAEMFDVSTSLIRYWETEFKNLKPQKNRNGDRKFTVKDIKELEKIYTLVKEKGYTLIGAQRELRTNKTFVYKSKAILKLEKIKSKMLKLKKRLD